MFLAHSFRLRDPWQCDLVEGGGVRWSRIFHRPTGLEPDDALWLVITGLPAEAMVNVNGQALTGDGEVPPRFEVTKWLTEANRIEIVIPGACSLQPTASFPFDARLAIVGHS